MKNETSPVAAALTTVGVTDAARLYIEFFFFFFNVFLLCSIKKENRRNHELFFFPKARGRSWQKPEAGMVSR